MTDPYTAAKRRNLKRHSAQHARKMAHARAAQARKRLASPPPERHERAVERMAICLVTWIDGKPYVRMMKLDPDGKASFRITAGGKLMQTREGPVTSLSGATRILRRRAVTMRRFEA